jgi:hypothetical protein
MKRILNFAKTHGRIPVAKDGHRCDSLAEKVVDDWLFRRDIKHKVNVPYPWGNGMTADFVVEDSWIEIFGLEGEHKRYDELKKEKLGLAKQHGIKIFALSLKDVYGGELEKKIKIGGRRRRPS